MRGYISRSNNQEAETGMLKFIDAELMVEGKFHIRLINLRNIKVLTFKLDRYEVAGLGRRPLSCRSWPAAATLPVLAGGR